MYKHKKVPAVVLSLILTVILAACTQPAESIETSTQINQPVETSTAKPPNTETEEESAAQPDPNANADITLDWAHYKSTEELLEAAGHVHVLSDLVYSETAERNLGFDTAISYDYYTATRILAEGSSVTEMPYTLRVLAGIDSTEARGLLAQDYEYYLVFVNGDQSEGTPLNPWQAIYGYNDGEIVSTAGDRGFALEVEELGGVRETLQEPNLP